jgi:hypothetical protein
MFHTACMNPAERTSERATVFILEFSGVGAD